MTARSLQRLLDALPSLPSRDESMCLERLRWALGSALIESQRAPMPTLPPLVASGQPVLARTISASAGVDVPMPVEAKEPTP